jgi:monovalent cation:H+ antiporter-2, CPA2 family
METAPQLIVDLALVLAAGVAGALLARALRLPLLVGYLLAGVVLGPSVLGRVSDSRTIEAISELGVDLLMFALGVELSFRSLGKAKAVAAIAAPAQILLCVGLGYGLGLLLGWPAPQALVFGFVLSLSSTMIVVKLLTEKGELHTHHGRVLVALLLVQDLAAVIMIGLLPVLPNIGAGDYFQLCEIIGFGAVFVGLTAMLATWVAPALMDLVGRNYSKEIFVATAALLCFGGAALSYSFGFSLAIGAFVAGLMISESRYRHEILASVTPLRDLFGMVFFVSLGLLFNRHEIMQHPGWTLALLAAVFFGKALVSTVALMLSGYHARTSLIAGFSLAQIGEFSFLIVLLAQRTGLLNSQVGSLIIAVAALSFLASPALANLGKGLYNLLRRWGPAEKALAAHELAYSRGLSGELKDHVILCGYGRVGRPIGEILREEKQPLAVIECEHEVITEMEANQVPALFGDATSPLLLKAAGAATARLAILALPDPLSTRLALKELRRLNPTLPVIARVHLQEEIEPMYAAGTEEAVFAEFEAGLEIIRHSLLRLGHNPEAVQARLDAIRQSHYDKFRREEA